MSILAKLDEHANLMHRMSDRVGVDLAEEVMRGEVAAEELQRAVFRCCGCIDTVACAAWLGDQDGPANTAPDYCRNKPLFDELARR